MAKTKVDFRPNRIDEGNWQIIAALPGHEDRHIKGLTSREDCYDWLNGNRKIEWLRSQGYAKCARSGSACGWPTILSYLALSDSSAAWIAAETEALSDFPT